MASKMPSTRRFTRSIDGHRYELAKQCAESGFDLLIGADEPEINAPPTDNALSHQGRRRQQGGTLHDLQALDSSMNRLRGSTGSTLCWRCRTRTADAPFSIRNLRRCAA